MSTSHTLSQNPLRILVFSDPLCSQDHEALQSYLAVTLQLRFPKRPVVAHLWCSAKSHSLEEKLKEIAHLSKLVADDNLAPYDWFLPLLFLPIEAAVSIETRVASSYLRGLPEFVASTSSVASHTLLTTIATSKARGPVHRSINPAIKALARADRRHLLDLDAILQGFPPSPRTWSLICEAIASAISEQESRWDKSEQELSGSISPQGTAQYSFKNEPSSHHFEDFTSFVAEPSPAVLQNRAQQTTKDYKHEYTEEDRLRLRKELDKRFVQRQHVQEQGAKRTSKIKITRPDRIHADDYRPQTLSSPLKRRSMKAAKGSEENDNENELHGSRNFQSSPLRPARDRQQTTGAANEGALKPQIYNPSPSSPGKRTHQEAFKPVAYISPYPPALASMAAPPKPSLPRLASDLVVREDGSVQQAAKDLTHPVFSRSYETGTAMKEKKKKGRIVVLKYTPKPKPDQTASTNEHRGSSVSMDRSSSVVDGRLSSANTEISDDDVVVDSNLPDDHPDKVLELSYQNRNNNEPNVASEQRQVSDAASLLPEADPRGSHMLQNFPRINAGDLANPLHIDGLADLPGFVFNPLHIDVHRFGALEADLARDNIPLTPKVLAYLTGTVNPAVLEDMTSEDVLEAHLPVLEGYRALYPELFSGHDATPPAPSTVPALQINGEVAQGSRMRRDSVPAPLNLAQQSREGPRGGLNALPTPVSPGLLGDMAEDLRTARNTPDVQNNSANLRVPATNSPPTTPGLQQAVPQARQSSHQGHAQVPGYGHSVVHGSPAQREMFLSEIQRNVQRGRCSFCGLPNGHADCRHRIVNRPANNDWFGGHDSPRALPAGPSVARATAAPPSPNYKPEHSKSARKEKVASWLESSNQRPDSAPSSAVDAAFAAANAAFGVPGALGPKEASPGVVSGSNGMKTMAGTVDVGERCSLCVISGAVCTHGSLRE